MHITPEQDSLINSIIEDHESIAQVDFDKLRRAHEGHEDLTNAIGLLDTIHQELRCIRNKDAIAILSTNSLQKIRDTTSRLQQILKTLEGSGPRIHKEDQNLPALLTSIRDLHESTMTQAMPELAYIRSRLAHSHQASSNAIELTKTVQARLDKMFTDMSERLSEASTLLKTVKEEASEAGVAAHADVFQKHADTSRKKAFWWLITAMVAFAILLAASVAGLIAVLFGYFQPETTLEAIQFSASKIIVLSILSYAAIWTSQNCRKAKHNEVLNSHRAAAMSTFEIFKAGASDDATKDAVLLFCAQAAFGHQSTGYDHKDPSEGTHQIINPVIDIMRNSHDK